MSTFDPKIGDCQGEADLEFFDGTLVYVHRGNSGDEVWEAVCTNPQSPSAENVWSVAKVDEETVETEVVTEGRPQLVVHREYLYLLWSDSSWKTLAATRRTSEVTTTGEEEALPAWRRYVILADAEGFELDTDGAVFAALAVGNTTLVTIVKPLSVTYLVYDFGSYPNEANGPAEGADELRWRAVSSTTIPLSKVAELAGTRVLLLVPETSIALYSVGGASEDGSTTGNTLVQSFSMLASVDADGEKTLARVPFMLQVQLNTGNLPDFSRASGNLWSSKTKYDITLRTDPGGRIRAMGRDKDDVVWTSLLNTSKFPGGWSSSTIATGNKANGPPSFVYVPSGDQKQESVNGKTATTQSVNQVILVANDSIVGDSGEYGRLLKVNNMETLNVTAASTSKKKLLEGYIDGPPPLPQVNVDLNPLEVNVGVIYGDTKETDVADQFSVEFSLGITSTGTGAPAVGAGPTWDISLSVGAGRTFGTSASVSLTETVELNAVLSNTTKQVQPVGVAVFDDIILTRDEFQFIPQGATEPVSDAPTFSLVYLDLRGDGKDPFTVGTVTPGNLETYTEAAWNARMKPLYEDLYGRGKNYIDDVVKTRALTFRVGDEYLNSIEVDWSIGSGDSPKLYTTQTTFESLSTSLDASVFTGVTARFLGAEATLMRGFTLAVDATKTTTQIDGFGIEAVTKLPAPTDGEPGVVSYSYDIYFLPSSPDWVREFKYFLPANDPMRAAIPDSGMSCWKIMYVVTHVQYNAAIGNLMEFGMPGEELLKWQERGVRTTNQLLTQLGVRSAAHIRSIGDRPMTAENAAVINALRRWDEAKNRYRPASRASSVRKPPPRLSGRRR